MGLAGKLPQKDLRLGEVGRFAVDLPVEPDDVACSRFAGSKFSTEASSASMFSMIFSLITIPSFLLDSDILIDLPASHL